MWRLLLPALIIVLVGGGVSAFLFRERSSDPLGAEAPTSVSSAPTRTQGVVAEAKVLPAVDVTLSFLTPALLPQSWLRRENVSKSASLLHALIHECSSSRLRRPG